MTGRLLLLTQDPGGRGGAATVVTAARTLLQAAGVPFDHVFPAVLSEPRVSLVRLSASRRLTAPGRQAGSVGLLAVLPELQVPAYVSASLALRHLARTHRWSGVLVAGASAMHGSIAAGLALPHVVWLATTLADERSSQWASYSPTRRIVHGATLRALRRRETRTLRTSRGNMVMGAHGQELLRQQSMPCMGSLYPPVRPNRHGPERREAELRNRRLVLLFVGRVFDERKRFAMTLDVAGRLAGLSTWESVTLAVTGTPEELARFATPVNLVVEALGHPGDDELAQAYGRAHVLVMTSKQEGFGIVAAEAMTAGVLCVTTSSGGPEEVIREGGGLVRDGASSLCDAVSSLVRRPEEWGTASVKAAKYAEETFGWEPARGQMAALLGALR